MTDHTFPVLPIKHLVNQYGELTTPDELSNSTKPSVSNFTCSIFPCVVLKSTAHVYTRALNICHQSQNKFVSSSLEYHNIKKCTWSTYLVHGK